MSALKMVMVNLAVRPDFEATAHNLERDDDVAEAMKLLCARAMGHILRHMHDGYESDYVDTDEAEDYMERMVPLLAGLYPVTRGRLKDATPVQIRNWQDAFVEQAEEAGALVTFIRMP